MIPPVATAEYACPVCSVRDRNAYLTCNRADCTDGRDLWDRSRAGAPREDAVDFDVSLTANLKRNGVTHKADSKFTGRQTWKSGDQYIGSFTAEEGWLVLRHYNLIGLWDLAVKEADREMRDGYGYPAHQDAAVAEASS